jgi:protein required for attachment to host cells
VSAGDVKSIVLVAPPRALGVLRNALSPALKGVVRAEIDKDLVAVPVYEIEKRLTAA